MTTLQLALVAGGLLGAGVAAIVWRFAPVHANLGAFFNAMSHRDTRLADTTTPPVDVTDKVGRRLQRSPLGTMITPPAADLAILRMSPARYLGEKAIQAVTSLIVPGVAAVIMGLMGMPAIIPAIGGLILAGASLIFHDRSIRSRANLARSEFRATLAAYLDLVALERQAMSAPRQALERAARIGDSWVFKAISERLVYARWSGEPPWDGLAAMAETMRLPELDDLASIVRISAEEGAGIYQQLRARAAALRSEMMSADLAESNAANERLSVPVSVLTLLFLVLISTPAFLRLAGLA